jgi:hypothetical protein
MQSTSDVPTPVPGLRGCCTLGRLTMLEKCSAMVLGVAAALLAPAVALAEQPALRVGLDYRRDAAPPDCPTADELQRAIVRQLGYDPFTADSTTDEAGPRDYEVRVEIVGVGSGTRAHIEWLDGSRRLEGERRLSSESSQCAELASGVVFAVAVQLQLRAASSPRRAAAPLRPAPKPRPAPLPDRSVLASVGMFAQRGAQPGLAAGLRAFGAWRARGWSLGLGAQATLPTTEPAADGAGFSARELGLNLAPCVRYGSWDACALGTLGLLTVRGEGVDQARTPSAPLLGAGLRLQLVWPKLEKLAGLAHLDVVALLTPRDVQLNHERVWSTAPIVIGLGLDLAAIFR